MIAALFVERRGAYFGIPGVDPWDVTRDARAYAGPWPVVAHPPCQRWGPAVSVCEIERQGRPERLATPLPFRDLLLALAALAVRERGAA